MRLVVVQPYAPRYRTTFYRKVSQRLAAHGIPMVLVVGRTDSPRADSDTTLDVVVSRDLLEARTGGRLRYRRLRGLVAGDDLLLLEQAVKNLDGYASLLRTFVGGPSLGLWGHGRSYSAPQRPLVAAAKDWLTRRADWFFAYTDGGADHVIEHGFPASRVTVLNNTFDTAELRAELDAVTTEDVSEFASEHQITPARTALFLGGLDAKKDTHYLEELAAVAAAMDPDFSLLVAGEGPDSERLAKAVTDGLPLRLLGRVDGPAKALALSTAQTLIIPSQIGLVVIDSFTAAVPIMGRSDRLHGPEVEYLDPSRNCVLLDRDAPPGLFARTMLGLMHDPARLQMMREACAAQAPKYSLDAMVDAFVEGVLSWAEVRRFGL